MSTEHPFRPYFAQRTHQNPCQGRDRALSGSLMQRDANHFCMSDNSVFDICCQYLWCFCGGPRIILEASNHGIDACDASPEVRGILGWPSQALLDNSMSCISKLTTSDTCISNMT
jgi:hypothetical protein